MYANAVKMYENVQKTTMSGREIEAQVLTRAALKLKDCQDQWQDEGHFRRLDNALTYNQKVWSVLQAELVKPENLLPVELKQNILGLSVFIDKRILDIMAAPEPEKLDAIININQSLAAGLRTSSGS